MRFDTSIRSINLEEIQVNEIDRLLLALHLGPLSYTGATTAVFQSFGTILAFEDD